MAQFIYERVYIIGVDGAGAFFEQAHTPCMDAIFAGGASGNQVQTEMPSISSDCWGALLYGVAPERHRFTNGATDYMPVPEDYPIPSVFDVARERYPGCELASFCPDSPQFFIGRCKPMTLDDLFIARHAFADEDVARLKAHYE